MLIFLKWKVGIKKANVFGYTRWKWLDVFVARGRRCQISKLKGMQHILCHGVSASKESSYFPLVVQEACNVSTGECLVDSSGLVMFYFIP